MRVQLISKVDSQITGLRRYQDTLFHHLVRHGIDAQIIFPQPPLPTLLISFLQRSGWDLAAFFRSYPVRGCNGSADVYHLANESLATLLFFQKMKPCVVTVHGLLPYLLRHDRKRSLYHHGLHRWFDELAVKGLHRAQGIIAVSKFLKDVLVHQVGLLDERIRVIPEAVDQTSFYPQPVPVELKERYGLNSKRRYILYVGSEQPEKNFLTLVKAFGALRKRRDDVKLLKVGQPEYQSEREKAVRLIKQLGIQTDVVFLGHVGEDLPLIYNASDLFVFPSRHEGFGFPPLEAMACGIPVICSNATALPEVVGDAALLIDPMDEGGLVKAMERILSDEDLRKEYISRGIENVRRFSWDVTTLETIELYQQVMSHG